MEAALSNFYVVSSILLLLLLLFIKTDLQEVGRGCGDWMELAQDRDRHL